MKDILSFALLGGLLSSFSAKADRVQILNENKKELSVKISAEGDPLTENLAKKRIDIPAEHCHEFYVTSSDLHGNSLYSIEGETNPFTPRGTCKNMSVHKKYKVTFKNDTLGTSCVATEIGP